MTKMTVKNFAKAMPFLNSTILTLLPIEIGMILAVNRLFVSYFNIHLGPREELQ